MFDPLQLLLEMEAEMTENMTRLLARGSLDSAEWQAQKLSEVGALKIRNTETVEKYLAELEKELPDYYKSLGGKALTQAGLYDTAVNASPSLLLTWQIWETQTMNQFKRLGMALITEAQTIYIQIVYKSTARMLAGDLTLREAIAKTAAEWLDNGIPALVDKADRNWSVEAYAQTVLRSNERQVMTATQNQAFNENDIDLVEISSHAGARPLCAPYQGKIYSRSGRSTKYPALSETSMGEIAGLFGINCGHYMTAYFPSVGKTFDTYSKKENDKAYENSQRQREIERQIRNAKRRESIANINANSTEALRAKKNVSDAQQRMRDFLSDTGGVRRYDREQIY